MAKATFNNDNIKQKLDEIRAAETEEKQQNIDSIRENLRQCIKDNFSLSTEQERNLDDLPEDGLSEIGNGIALALENNWGLMVGGIPSNTPENEVKQEVKVGHGEQGAYVEKKVSWSWK